MKVREILEKWDEEAHINPEKKGMFDGKTVVQLEAELAALRKAGPHPEGSAGFTKMKEIEFAIRAKKAKGGKWAGVDTDKTEDHKPTEVAEAVDDKNWIAQVDKTDKSTPKVCINCGQPKAGHYYINKGWRCKGTWNKSFTLGEAWAEEAKVKHTGRNTNKSVAELKSERAKAKKRGDTKAIKQKDFAIRAKRHFVGNTK